MKTNNVLMIFLLICLHHCVSNFVIENEIFNTETNNEDISCYCTDCPNKVCTTNRSCYIQVKYLHNQNKLVVDHGCIERDQPFTFEAVFCKVSASKFLYSQCCREKDQCNSEQNINPYSLVPRDEQDQIDEMIFSKNERLIVNVVIGVMVGFIFVLLSLFIFIVIPIKPKIHENFSNIHHEKLYQIQLRLRNIFNFKKKFYKNTFLKSELSKLHSNSIGFVNEIFEESEQNNLNNSNNLLNDNISSSVDLNDNKSTTISTNTNKETINETSINGSSGCGVTRIIQSSISKQILLKRVIGFGKFGKVFEGIWNSQKVAVKVMEDSPESMHEAAIYHKYNLRHENLLYFISMDKYFDNGFRYLWLIFDYYPCGSLFDYISNRCYIIVEEAIMPVFQESTNSKLQKNNNNDLDVRNNCEDIPNSAKKELTNNQNVQEILDNNYQLHHDNENKYLEQNSKKFSSSNISPDNIKLNTNKIYTESNKNNDLENINNKVQIKKKSNDFNNYQDKTNLVNSNTNNNKYTGDLNSLNVSKDKVLENCQNNSEAGKKIRENINYKKVYIYKYRYDINPNILIRNILKSITAGILYLHTEIIGHQIKKPSIVHRDIKTKNILIKYDGTCCISDLGLSLCEDDFDYVKNNSNNKLAAKPSNSFKKAEKHKNVEESEDNNVKGYNEFKTYSHINSNYLVGTSRYTAPELYIKKGNKMKIYFEDLLRSDIYSLGLLIWECFSGLDDHRMEYQIPYLDIMPNRPTEEEIYQHLCRDGTRPIFRLKNTEFKFDNNIIQEIIFLTDLCWHITPEVRPTIEYVKKKIDRIFFI